MKHRHKPGKTVRITLLHMYIEKRTYPAHWPNEAIHKRLVEQGYDYRIKVLEAK